MTNAGYTMLEKKRTMFRGHIPKRLKMQFKFWAKSHEHGVNNRKVQGALLDS